MPKDFLSITKLVAHLKSIGVHRDRKQIATDCQNGKIPGAEKEGAMWWIPVSAIEDYLPLARRKQGRPRKEKNNP